MFSFALLLPGVTNATPGSEPHVVDAAELQEAIDAKLDQAGEDREAIRSLLSRPQVNALAAGAGLDLHRANIAVDALSGPGLSSLASQARQLDAQLAADSSARIPTTTIIIALLVLIVLILVV
jgi:hypothetical protein